MRNRLAIAALHPVPLPDSILNDGWWLVRRPVPADQPIGLRLVTSGTEEHAREQDRGDTRAGTS
jgi:hypothetical protein